MTMDRSPGCLDMKCQGMLLFHVQLDGLELKSGLPEGCGVVATRKLKEGEEILRIPHPLMMTTVTAHEAGVRALELRPCCMPIPAPCSAMQPKQQCDAASCCRKCCRDNTCSCTSAS